MCDPGPSFTRTQPIENNPIIIEDDEICSSFPNFPATIIFKIVTMADWYAECSLGIHTNIDRFFTRHKSRIGYEVSVHGHRIREKYQRRGSIISTDIKETKNASENSKDWIDKQWADGDIIKLVFDNPKLTWWWNGIEQSCIDVSDENDRIVAETSKQRSQNPKVDGNAQDIEPKWCFYARGVRMKIGIQDKDLTEKEYEELRNSYASRLKVMKDAIEKQGPGNPDDW